MEPISLVVIGGRGRMGGALLEAAGGDKRFRVAAGVDRPSLPGAAPSPPPFFTDLEEALGETPGAVVVDVSSSEDAVARIQLVARMGFPLVEGTTALDDHAHEEIRAAAKLVPVVVAPNFSPGVALLRHALDAVLSAKDLGWDIGIVDRHHRKKQDAPSGTARLLESDIAKGARSLPHAPEVVSLRQGGLVGEHTIFLSSEEEELFLGHRALSRGVFARGALLAAAFAHRAGAGLYAIEDVLGLER